MNEVSEKRKTFWSVKELAAVLGVSKALIYEHVCREEIPCKRIGRRILIPDKFVSQMISE